jgi:AcrR family transcriptional regulator
MRTVNPEKIAQQKNEIIAAAIRAFSRIGLDATLTADICKAAGISQGRLYYYFKSKEAVIDAVVQETFTSSLRLAQDVSAGEDLISAIVDSHEAVQARCRETGVSASLLREILNLAERDPNVHRLFGMHVQRSTDLIASRLRREREAGRLRPDANIDVLALAVGLTLSGAQALDGVAPHLGTAQIREVIEAILLPWMVQAKDKRIKRSKRS